MPVPESIPEKRPTVARTALRTENPSARAKVLLIAASTLTAVNLALAAYNASHAARNEQAPAVPADSHCPNTSPMYPRAFLDPDAANPLNPADSASPADPHIRILLFPSNENLLYTLPPEEKDKKDEPVNL